MSCKISFTRSGPDVIDVDESEIFADQMNSVEDHVMCYRSQTSEVYNALSFSPSDMFNVQTLKISAEICMKNSKSLKIRLAGPFYWLSKAYLFTLYF